MKLDPLTITLPNAESLIDPCGDCGERMVNGWCEFCRKVVAGGIAPFWTRFRCSHEYLPLERLPSNWRGSTRLLSIYCRAVCQICGIRKEVGTHRLHAVAEEMVGDWTVMWS